MEATQARPTKRSAEAILGYRNEKLIARHMRDCEVPEGLAHRRFVGLKQFMYVAATTPGRKVSSPGIDEIWHSFLLFSRDYREFCDEYLGRRVDHDPFEAPAPGVYPETRARAAEAFGSLDSEIWPTEGQADCTSGCQD